MRSVPFSNIATYLIGMGDSWQEENIMSKERDRRIWVVVRVQRGFVSDIRAFRERELARRQERSWRRRMNRDYDETGVSEVLVNAVRMSA